MAANSKNSTKINTVTRYFNRIEVIHDWLKKTSTYSSKFLDEINWFLKLPESAKEFVPTIKSINNKKTPYSITYKYLTYPTLHTQLCFAEPQQKFWKHVKKQYKAFLNECKKAQPEEFDEEYWHSNLMDMYLTKTIKRLEEVEKNKNLAYWFNNKYITVNDKRYPSAASLLKYLKDGVKNNLEDDVYAPLKKLVTPVKGNICFIHGDLVFSNVFVYKRGHDYEFKCIDPRGSFGKDKEFGDLNYDYAKVYQSVFGLYDYILENSYDWLFDEKVIKYWIHQSNITRACQRTFKRNFFPMMNLQKIKLIESLQFLSMVPLHNDRPDHQKLFLTHGIVRFAEAMGKKWKL